MLPTRSSSYAYAHSAVTTSPLARRFPAGGRALTSSIASRSEIASDGIATASERAHATSELSSASLPVAPHETEPRCIRKLS